MTRTMVLLLLLCATRITAQQLTPTTTPSTAQPVTRSLLAPTGAPETPASGWALTPDGDPTGPLSLVTTRGGGVRITAPGPTTIFRPQWTLAGTFSVGALVQSSDPTAIYGLTVGGRPASPSSCGPTARSRLRRVGRPQAPRGRASPCAAQPMVCRARTGSRCALRAMRCAS